MGVLNKKKCNIIFVFILNYTSFQFITRYFSLFYPIYLTFVRNYQLDDQ